MWHITREYISTTFFNWRQLYPKRTLCKFHIESISRARFMWEILNKKYDKSSLYVRVLCKSIKKFKSFSYHFIFPFFSERLYFVVVVAIFQPYYTSYTLTLLYFPYHMYRQYIRMYRLHIYKLNIYVFFSRFVSF